MTHPAGRIHAGEHAHSRLMEYHLYTSLGLARACFSSKSTMLTSRLVASVSIERSREVRSSLICGCASHGMSAAEGSAPAPGSASAVPTPGPGSAIGSGSSSSSRFDA